MSTDLGNHIIYNHLCRAPQCVRRLSCQNAFEMPYLHYWSVHCILVLLHMLRNRCTALLWGDCIATIPIILFAPIAHANKPLSNRVYQWNRTVSIILTLGLIISAFFLNLYNHTESAVISLTLWIVSLSMIPAIDIHSPNLRRHKT